MGEVDRYKRLANDISKFSESEEDLERTVQEMHSESLVVRLEVDMKGQCNVAQSRGVNTSWASCQCCANHEKDVQCVQEALK